MIQNFPSACLSGVLATSRRYKPAATSQTPGTIPARRPTLARRFRLWLPPPSRPTATTSGLTLLKIHAHIVLNTF